MFIDHIFTVFEAEFLWVQIDDKLTAKDKRV